MNDVSKCRIKFCMDCGVDVTHELGKGPAMEPAPPLAIELPSWEFCAERVALGFGNATALEKFIYHNEPATVPLPDFQSEDDFRELLGAMLLEARK